MEKEKNKFPVVVSYDESVESLIARGKYCWKAEGIKSENFPTKRTGKKGIVIELLGFDKNIRPRKIIREISKLGYRPATLHELLAFTEKYPKETRRYEIIALGSVWKDPEDGESLCPSVSFFPKQEGCMLNLEYLNATWGISKKRPFRLAVVGKNNKQKR